MLRTLPLLIAAFASTAPYLTAQITVSFPAAVSSRPLDGRVLLLLSTDPAKEPRMQIDDSPRSQIVFGVTVDGLAPDQAATITNEAAGYPIRSLDQVPVGDYYVQAVLNVYQTFHRANGTTVKLAPDRGEGQHWNLAPGNLYSKPVKVHIDEPHQACRPAHRNHPAHRPEAGHQVRSPHPHPEPAADKVLGHAHVPLRHRSGA